MSLEEDRQRKLREKQHRDQHRRKYWEKHDRDNYECPVCGAGQEDTKWFEVHHADGDPTNGDFGNLVALCRECHYRLHGREVPQTLEEWKDDFESLGE